MHKAVVALTHHIVVEHLVTHGTGQEDAQVHVLVTEAVGPAEGELGKRGTNVGAVQFIDLAVAVHILELEVAGPYGGIAVEHTVLGELFGLGGIHNILEVLVNAHDLVAVEVVEGLTDLGHGNDIVPLAVTYELSVGTAVQGDELVLVEGNLEVAVPAEVLIVNRVRIQGDFQTAVADGTVVTLRGGQGGRTVTLGTHIGRKGHGHQHVGGHLLVHIDGEVEAVGEEAEVNTQVGLNLLFPVNTGVGDVGGTLAVAKGRRHLAHAGFPGAGADVGVTGLAPAQADLTVVEDVLVGEELLVGETPAAGYGMEACPTVIRAEVGGTIITEGIGQQITVVVVVGLTGEEGGHGGRAEAAADGGRLAGCQGNIVDLIGREVRAGGSQIVPAGFPGFLTHHSGDAVLAEGVGIGEVVLQGPVEAGVALLADGVATLLESTQGDLGFVGVGLGAADIEANLTAEHEVLDGSEFGVDVTGELLALEGALVVHSHGHRVLGGIAFADNGGVVAVDIVDGDIGQGRQGVEDNTFLTVGEFQVIVGESVGGVDAELEPVLELGIQVGAEAQTVEVGTDDGTFLVHIGTGHIVLDLLGTAGGAHLVLVLEGGAEHLVLPVGTLAQDGGIGVKGIGGNFAQFYHIVIILSEFAEVHHIDAAGLAGHGEHTVIGELGIAGLTVLGGDEHNTVSTLGTVNGGGRSILEDFHAHDIGRVDGGQRGDGGNATVTQGITQTEVSTGIAAALNDDAVDDVQRFSVGVHRGLTTNADRGAGTRSTGGLHGGNTRGAALQGLVQVGNDGALDVFFLHRDGSAGKVTPFHCTVTHDDNLVEEFGILFQDHVDDSLSAHNDFLSCITDGREHERSAGLHRDLVVSIQVCDDTVVGALLHYRYSDSRSHIVGHVTANLGLCEQGRGGEECQHEGHKFLFHATRLIG